MINVTPVDLRSRIKTSDMVFHMEAGNGWIRTFGNSTAPINTSQVYVEKYSGFIDVNRDALKAENDANVGTITINDNLFSDCASTKQITITMWLFISDREPGLAFYPVKFGNDCYLYIDPKTFIFRTGHYYTGISYKDIVPNNRWFHVLITIDNRDHMKSRITIYMDGKLISTGYTKYGFNVGTSPNTNTAFGVDFAAITGNTVTNRWEFLGKRKAGAYLLREFTIYKKSLVENQEEYIVPVVSTTAITYMILSNRKYIGYKIIGSIDPHPLNDPNPLCSYGPTYGLTQYCGGERLNNPGSLVDPSTYYAKTTTSSNQLTGRSLDPLFYYADNRQYIGSNSITFNITGWSGNVDMSTGVAKVLVSIDIIVRYIKHVTQDQSEDLIEPGTQYTSQDGIKNFSGQVRFYLNGRMIKLSTEFFTFNDNPPYDLIKVKTPHRYNGVDTYFEYHEKLTELVYLNSPNVLRIDTGGMPMNNQRVWIRHFEGDISGGLAKCVRWDIWSRLVVPDYWMHAEFPCQITVVNTGYADIIEVDDGSGNKKKYKWRITLPIPFPYPQFYEMEWLLIAPDGRFVPEVYYDKIDNFHIRFKDWNPFDSGYEEKFAFTFLHKHGFYAVNKFEQNVYAKRGVRTYQFNSPYDSLVDLQKRVKVFLNCHFLNPDLDLYSFDSETGIITFSNKFTFKSTDLITMLCFYTGTKQADGTISRLPMSGYVEFRTPFEDRVWDKDSFAIFMNGKLLSRDLITDMSSTIHKINKDIKTRYNLEVLNMAPRISYITPYLLAAHKRQEVKDVVWELACKLTVPYDEFYKPRYYIEPDIFNPVEWKPLFPHNLNWYISLVHHGLNEAEKDYQQNLEYTLTFYKDEYTRNPESVMVVGQARLKGNIEEFHPDSESNTLIGILPYKLTQNDKDRVLFSIQAATIIENDLDVSYLDYKDSIDGVMCRLEIQDEKKDKWYRVYYELYCNNYERDTEIEILEWVISSEPNGEGDVWYRKTIPFIPYDTPNFPPMDVMPSYD